MYRLFTTALVAASSVSALSLSSGCQSALTQVAGNADANACLSISSLISTVIQSNSSIVTPVDNMLKALCAAAPCTNATLSAIVTNITTGCSTELSSTGSSAPSASTLTTLVQQYYPTVRNIVCLTDSGTNCITQTLTNLQAILGTLSINNIGGVLSKALTTTSVPANVTCTNCNKQAFNVLNQAFPGTLTSESSALQSQCGASFTDGNTPAGIVQSAKTTTTKPSSAPATTMARGALAALTASVLVATSFWAFA
ncbi:hypothetical protein B0H15DRAFT_599593 [Mycena belliarum]|uniref:Uncharacterized protein n=1 Tax=Mycena belliarum TaxID=1033014 RepID=A0AAD6TSY1_9AGAR|nr:hypothetical protein B0H15DRAFT_599593 [Mycena belliae]